MALTIKAYETREHPPVDTSRPEIKWWPGGVDSQHTDLQGKLNSRAGWTALPEKSKSDQAKPNLMRYLWIVS